MNRVVNHICFDKDGTITDVHQYWAHTCNIRARELTKRYGLSQNEIEPLLDVMGIDPVAVQIKKGGPVGYKPRAEIIESLLRYFASAGVKANKDDIANTFKLIDKYQQETNDFKIVLLPGVIDFIEKMSCFGMMLTIYSSDRKDNIQNVLDQLAIAKHFRAVLGGDSVVNPKPHPEGFLRACELAGSTPYRSIYISDTVEDLEMAKAGNAAMLIGVETGLANREELSIMTKRVYKNLSFFKDADLKINP